MSDKIPLKGIIFKDKNTQKYYAVCLTTNHISSADNIDKAMAKLIEQIDLYIHSIVEHKGKDITIKDIRRPAPLIFWYRYLIMAVLYKLASFVNMAIDSFKIFNSFIDPKNSKICLA